MQQLANCRVDPSCPWHSVSHPVLLFVPAPAAPQLIRVCSEHGQAVTALSVYEWMKAPASVGGAGLGPTVYTYTAAMRAALAAGLLDRALQVWEDAQAAKCAVDCRLCITYVEVGVGVRLEGLGCMGGRVFLQRSVGCSGGRI